MEPLLKVTNLSKNFDTLLGVQNISFDVSPGEVVGLVGRSGAGKSVITMLLTGLYIPTEGEIYFDGQPLIYPFEPRSLGIETIYQQPNLVEQLDITSNVFLGRELCWKVLGVKIPNRRQMDKEAARIMEFLGLSFPSLRKKIVHLSGEQRRMISLAQVMAHPAKLIIIDDPPDSLSYANQQKLRSLIQTWRQQGVAVIFCSNDLEHLFAVSDRLIVLRHGRQVAVHRTDETSREEIASDLIGTTDRRRLTPAIWALDSYYRARAHAEKLHHQQMLLQRNLAAKDTHNQQLIEQLAEQVKALDQANLALQDAQRRLLTEREEERKHLARELHDQLIQDLLAVNYQLENVQENAHSEPDATAELVEIRDSISLFVDDLRSICSDLRPPTIDNLGLGVALQSYTRDWSDRSNISANLVLDTNLGRLPEAIELSIFRIVQEGLNNVRKHAHATNVEIFLKHTSPRTLMISIIDDGHGLAEGFNLSNLSAQGHYGLLGISERVALLGGRLKLRNQTDGGMLIQVEIPHPRVEISRPGLGQ